MPRPSPLRSCRRAFPCSPPFTALRNADPRHTPSAWVFAEHDPPLRRLLSEGNPESALHTLIGAAGLVLGQSRLNAPITPRASPYPLRSNCRAWAMVASAYSASSSSDALLIGWPMTANR